MLRLYVVLSSVSLDRDRIRLSLCFTLIAVVVELFGWVSELLLQNIWGFPFCCPVPFGIVFLRMFKVHAISLLVMG